MSGLTGEEPSVDDGVADHIERYIFFLLEDDNSDHFKTNLFAF